MVLVAIKYNRGSLHLLEQRRLPLETDWLNVRNTEDGWTAIRDMTVRGAPAIAIAAALSLAVELVGDGGGAQFASASKALDHVNKKLDYLATSRPTAVNLFDAVKKLSKVATTASSAPGATGQTVCDAVITCAEAMLEEDVAANRSMGKHGADALLAAAQARGRARDGKLRVLTHCNTGSLATAAFGTALGVIRSLHEAGRLEHAFCTETRPYNQGARLTAFELVTDGLPATLVCDSAAAALMSEGRVDAVVVGADRIAANGDTANKIGTFSLAVAAAYHNIPFFTAAPTTTLDPELKDGTLIPIEQRSPEEVTHFKGERVAAEISVWNPSFDVTPAALLEGIITECGMVPRLGPKPCAFGVRPWLQRLGLLASDDGGSTAGENGGTAADGGTTTTTTPLPTAPGFKQLNSESVKEYVAARPLLAAHVGPSETSASWQVEEVGDGNLNFVFILRGPAGGALCIKQAPPYVRCVGEDWPLTQDRVRIEAAALAEEVRHCPEHVPQLYYVDAPMCLIVMQYIPPPSIILRKGLIQGITYPRVAQHLSSLLTRTLFHTSLLAMSSEEFRQQIGRFSNPEMCALTEQVIFTDPYFSAKFNRHTSPHLDAAVAELHKDTPAKVAAAKLKSLFIQKAQALLHGDLHTGSIMVTQDATYAIDPEFAFVGPIAFDVAKIIANLLLAYYASDGHAAAGGTSRAEHKTWLLETAAAVWEGFKREFTELWDAQGGEGAAYPAEIFGDAASSGDSELMRKQAQADFFTELWAETVGFGGAVIIRRLLGIAHVADMEEIADQEVRAACELRALRFGRQMLVEGASAFPDVRALVRAASAAS